MSIKYPDYSNFDGHLWADFFELTCLRAVDRYLSRADMEDRVSLNIDDDFITFDDGSDALDEDVDKKEKVQDKLKLFTSDLIKFLKYRKSVYGEFYPFEVSDGIIGIENKLTDKHLFYVYLLMSSHLGSFRTETGTLTSDFELMSLNSLKGYFGGKARLEMFGKNSKHTTPLFKGNKFEKFKKLAFFFNEKCLFNETEFSPYDVGDDGIDIVGWINFSDEAPGKVLITGQCKCQTDWNDYRFSSASISLVGKLSLTHPNLNFSLIPICFRRENGAWHQSTQTAGTIVVDRQRIISMTNDLEIFRKSLSYNIVQTFVNSREGIV